MTSSTCNTLVFSTRRRDPELISPSRPTPHEYKYLSDIDEPRRKPDAVHVIREAIADALVFYYPFARRVRESPFGGKLVVECTGEGVMFIEADADIRLDQLGNMTELKPPFPCSNELLCIVPGSGDMINCPLLLVQFLKVKCHLHVTRFRCGGFTLGHLVNHTISDAQGLHQFMIAVSEIARGYGSPSVLPIWGRELLNSDEPQPIPNREECSSLLYCQRTWERSPKFAIRILYPIGYGMVFSTAEKLCRNPLGYALDLVKNSKNKLLSTKTIGDRETTMKRKFLRSWTDCMTNYALPGSHYFVTDVTRARFAEVDYGWGKAVYGGSIVGGPTVEYDLPTPEDKSLYIPFENNKGEYGILVPICFPQEYMDEFVVEVGRIVSELPVKVNNQSQTSKKPIGSAH
ncbi:hypothetical protein C5167_020291 [Papaver somniferum]|uniref:Uncharacterized protein n=1 Tax=Papaver somniferum TaxID=3469 RepID=A0A4Y7IVT9_PAPSO|nr:hypothetical protein C5167_020291 [Papaver somniferum]